ncbi:UDP-4-amino-4,6-dideoxy-N-acetyl-beta-L-altrosamine N-acetyltransferase [Helicobacter heilmannii]|uniref:FLAGELLAR PROTEIN G FLAG n=1 Tax=Helicobacter heilmannii TaxID=35817 RepID=A0A0K2Y4L7_HELHE|nr:UDP-4-amino-4,6-dideoxy-N-acetyl-beta-L-altrosamine N-acetyltransferase [Helicobacter heilmannii]CCM73335.1 flagellar protein G (flaG) [Helicobacter heilmannii ASB1.4]CRI34081.1 FLAGELLAR PROTEIN G FLAG [Helicobacter heilmannii]
MHNPLNQSFEIPSQDFKDHPPLHACHFCHATKNEKLQILAFRNHPSTTAWMYTQQISKEAHMHFIEQLQFSQNAAYYLFKQGQELLGVGSLTRIDFAHSHAFLGIYKNPSLERVGALILDGLEFIAFFKFGLHALHLEVMANNTRAIGFYERHAYRKGGFLRDFVQRQDNYYDVWLFSKISPLDKGLK